jgi:hypothetical protein
MNNRDRLIFLADGLDKKGLATEAAFIDEIIVKRSFDEDTRTNLRSVIQSINELVDELTEATKGQQLQNKTTGEWFAQGGLEPDKQDFFSERLDRIKQAVGYIDGLNAELGEDTPWPEEEPYEPPIGQGPDDGEPTDEGEGAEEEAPWWKFWEKSEEDEGDFDPEADRPPAEETTLPNPAPDETTFEEFDEELDEDEFDSDTGTVKRTRGRGVTVEQSMSNVGNVNIGYDETE